MPYRGRRGKSRGCFALDKEGIPRCNRKKGKGVKKAKGENSMYKIGEKKREGRRRER
jgi:hypothetical protein